jgi:RNA polymerase sigma-70 factor (ECF subfamily)
VNEKEIVKRAKKGDRQALSQLVTRYSERVYNLALRILRNREDAEDVLQETFLTVLEKFDTFDGRSAFFTWIYRIATNASLMKLRRKKIIYTEFPDNPDLERSIENLVFIDWSQDPTAGIRDKEVKQVLDKAISELPEIYRTVFILRDLEYLSIKETGKILEISEENVKIRLRRARLFLRDKLSNYFEEHVKRSE